ncbi:hypothetical protein RND71_042256 [Anisodus tanguticus]|uniref:Uncharacterized protein n=1 Tax=Anisodus tanguticus TaxID=243964 RepID=A0AAE1QPX2_9SOLA|nr:hypothetical protein RND71_042256 [Anisodus tanguticus]
MGLGPLSDSTRITDMPSLRPCTITLRMVPPPAALRSELFKPMIYGKKVSSMCANIESVCGSSLQKAECKELARHCFSFWNEKYPDDFKHRKMVEMDVYEQNNNKRHRARVEVLTSKRDKRKTTGNTCVDFVHHMNIFIAMKDVAADSSPEISEALIETISSIGGENIEKLDPCEN